MKKFFFKTALTLSLALSAAAAKCGTYSYYDFFPWDGYYNNSIKYVANPYGTEYIADLGPFSITEPMSADFSSGPNAQFLRAYAFSSYIEYDGLRKKTQYRGWPFTSISVEFWDFPMGKPSKIYFTITYQDTKPEESTSSPEPSIFILICLAGVSLILRRVR